jgi:hypothetical protein
MVRAGILFLTLFFGIQCYEDEPILLGPSSMHINGITMVAPPEPFLQDPITPIKNVNANWVAVIPYAYTPHNEAHLYYGNEWQWWGEKEEGVRESIRVAKEKNLSVMVKPQVYIPGSWVGDMDYQNEKDWLNWEEDYAGYIMHFAQIAAEEKAEMFCIGTEFKISLQKREAFWRNLISDVKSIYSGQLIYSANWDSYDAVPIWDVVDYIGLSSYFPLTNSKTPRVSELKAAWRPIVRKLENFSQKQQKHIVFTEFGYLTVDHCADKSWELEKKIDQLEINQNAQANAFEALFIVFHQKDFWAGGFIWKWFPNMRGHEGYPEKDYTPQGKKSESVITDWYALKK